MPAAGMHAASNGWDFGTSRWLLSHNGTSADYYVEEHGKSVIGTPRRNPCDAQIRELSSTPDMPRDSLGRSV